MSTELTPAMRRSVLIAALRHPEDWPAGFEWNFQYCKTCARGLAVQLLGLVESGVHRGLCEHFGLTEDQAWKIFAFKDPEGNESYPVPKHKITPSMVADRLEQIHKELTE